MAPRAAPLRLPLQLLPLCVRHGVDERKKAGPRVAFLSTDKVGSIPTTTAAAAPAASSSISTSTPCFLATIAAASSHHRTPHDPKQSYSVFCDGARHLQCHDKSSGSALQTRSPLSVLAQQPRQRLVRRGYFMFRGHEERRKQLDSAPAFLNLCCREGGRLRRWPRRRAK